MALLLPACSRIYQKPAKYKEVRELEKQFICIQTRIYFFVVVVDSDALCLFKTNLGWF